MAAMTRAQHLAWCKQRAMAEFDYYLKTEGLTTAVMNAKASMLSDLGKHPETSDSQLTACTVFLLPMHSRNDVKRMIEGFN